MKHLIKNPFPPAGKTGSSVRNGKNRRKLWKSISTSQNKGFLEKCDFTEPKKYFHSSQYLKKIEENGFFYSSRNKIFFKNYWPLSNCNNGFQKILNERISFPVNRKSVATGCNKEFV